MVKDIRDARRRAVEGLVFEFSPFVEVGKAYTVPGSVFFDGRQRVFLNPKHRDVVDEWKAALLDV